MMFVLAGCDFEVSNPGPVPDDLLDQDGSHAAVVQGASYALTIAQWQTSYHSSESAREITRSGRNFCCPKVPPRVGDNRREALENSVWNVSQRARFVAEDASRRFEEVLGESAANSYDLNAWAKLYAGFANRLLGENMCSAVIDGGEAQDVRLYFQRAEAAFSEAIQIAQTTNQPEVAAAAHAGRAAVRGPWLGDWSGALSDAGQVPIDFVFQAEHSTAQTGHYNHMWWLSSGDPWVDWTVYDSWVVDYYDATGDPRVAYVDRGHANTPLDLPMFEQRKFMGPGDGVNLASGREMALIRAEAALVDGNWQMAMDIINDEVRAGIVSDHTNDPIPPAVANNADEAWAALSHERRVELWLEGRRMGDLRRWIGNGSGGVPDIAGAVLENVSDRNRLCLPISNSEADSNPNFDRSLVEAMNPLYDGS